VVERLELRESGFLGIAEMTGRLDLQGSRIVEHPATLEVRLFGHSKMKTLKTIAGHLGLLSRLLSMRIRRSVSDERRVSKQKEAINTASHLTLK
jgi:hypothetical protein